MNSRRSSSVSLSSFAVSFDAECCLLVAAVTIYRASENIVITSYFDVILTLLGGVNLLSLPLSLIESLRRGRMERLHHARVH